MQVEDPVFSGGAEERSKATPPFDLSQGRESFDLTQDREPVERQMMPGWWIRAVTFPLPELESVLWSLL